MRNRKLTLRTFARCAKVFCLSAYYRYSMLYRPFTKLEKKLGVKGYETPKEPADNSITDEIGWLVPAVCDRTPWQSKCLVQALCARKLLNHENMLCTVYFGLARNEKGDLEAHAWLRCGNRTVTGGQVAGGFTVTGIYGDQAKGTKK